MPARRKHSQDLAKPRRANAGPEIREGRAQGILRYPEPSPGWSDEVVFLYEAALESGQAAYYETSDVALLWVACDRYNKLNREARPSAQMFTAVVALLSTLGLTEQDRVKARIELRQDVETEDDRMSKLAALQVAEYKRRLAEDPIPDWVPVHGPAKS